MKKLYISKFSFVIFVSVLAHCFEEKKQYLNWSNSRAIFDSAKNEANLRPATVRARIRFPLERKAEVVSYKHPTKNYEVIDEFNNNLVKEPKLKRNARDIQKENKNVDLCHSQHLQKCESSLWKEAENDLSHSHICKIREKFLDCMIKQRKLKCTNSSPNKLSQTEEASIRQRVKSIFWATEPCLLF